MAQRQAVTNRSATRYKQAGRVGRTLILGQLVDLIGWHREHARAALRRAGTVRVAKARQPRPPVYDMAVIVALQVCWYVARNRQEDASHQCSLCWCRFFA